MFRTKWPVISICVILICFLDYGWPFAISMVAVIFAINYSINHLNNNVILNFGRAIWARLKRYQKSKHKVPEASHVWKKEPAINTKGLKCVDLKSVLAQDCQSILAPDCQNMNHCDVCGANSHTNCSGNSHKDRNCVRHRWTVQSVDMANRSEEASFCCCCEEPCGGVLVADAPVWYCMWCQRLVHVDCHANLAKETEDSCDLGLRGCGKKNKSASDKGGNNGMATNQDMKFTDVSALPIKGTERKNGENEVDKLEFDGTNGEERLMILLNSFKVREKNRATCITTAGDLEVKKLKLIKTGLDANSIRICTICNVFCNSDKVFASHIAGEKHMVREKNRATCITTVGDLEAKKLKLIKTGLDANSIRTCTICNVFCNSDKDFASHIAGEKHMVNSKGLAQVLISQQAVYSANASTPDKESKEKIKNVLSAGQAPTVTQSVYCDICKVTCNTQEIYNNHVAGRKHNKKMKNLSMGNRPIQFVPAISISPGTQTCATDDNDQEHKPIGKSKSASKEDLEMKKRKVLESGAKDDEVKACELCNVVCTSPTVFESHCRGQKHRSMVKKQEENFGGVAVAPAVVPTANDNDQKHVHASSQMEPKPIGKSKSASKEDLEMKKRKVLESGVKDDEVKVCELCNVVCTSPTVFESHCRGQKHRSMVKMQEENFGGVAVAPAVVPTANDNDQKHVHASSQMEPKPKRKGKSACKEDLEMKKRKLLESGVKGDAVKVCNLCNVVCNSPTDFEFHCRFGAKHKSMVKKQ